MKAFKRIDYYYNDVVFGAIYPKPGIAVVTFKIYVYKQKITVKQIRTLALLTWLGSASTFLMAGAQPPRHAAALIAADTTIANYVQSMLTLYGIVYRPPAGEVKQRISNIQIKGRQLVITYLTCFSGKRTETFDIAKINPQYKVPQTESDTPQGRSHVVDQNTNKTIFMWLEKKADAAMLKADLKQLQTYMHAQKLL